MVVFNVQAVKADSSEVWMQNIGSASGLPSLLYVKTVSDNAKIFFKGLEI